MVVQLTGSVEPGEIEQGGRFLRSVQQRLADGDPGRMGEAGDPAGEDLGRCRQQVLEPEIVGDGVGLSRKAQVGVHLDLTDAPPGFLVHVLGALVDEPGQAVEVITLVRSEDEAFEAFEADSKSLEGSLDRILF